VTNLRYVTIDGFLDSQECKTLIEMAIPRLAPSTTWSQRSGRSRISDYRRSHQTFFKQGENELVSRIEQKIADITHLPVVNGEGLQVVRYLEGGYYKPHWDYFDPSLARNQVILERGGQRIVTVLMYLNTLVSSGGETYFPEMDLRIVPKEGMAIVWRNVDDSGGVDKSTYHEAMPVQAGEKWIMNTWLREHRFQYQETLGSEASSVHR
jgi:prolyl 4-hydroxylase